MTDLFNNEGRGIASPRSLMNQRSPLRASPRSIIDANAKKDAEKSKLDDWYTSRKPLSAFSLEELESIRAELAAARHEAELKIIEKDIRQRKYMLDHYAEHDINAEASARALGQGGPPGDGTQFSIGDYLKAGGRENRRVAAVKSLMRFGQKPEAAEAQHLAKQDRKQPTKLRGSLSLTGKMKERQDHRKAVQALSRSLMRGR